MKTVKTNNYIYEISNDSCGDCTTCKNRCENGTEMMLENWTPEEVEEVCSLIGKGLTSQIAKAMQIK